MAKMKIKFTINTDVFPAKVENVKLNGSPHRSNGIWNGKKPNGDPLDPRKWADLVELYGDSTCVRIGGQIYCW